MTPPTLIADRELRAQHERYAAAHERLVNGPGPSIKPKRPRPVSPFRDNSLVREMREAAKTNPALITVFPNLFTEVAASYPPATMVEMTVYLPGEIKRPSWRDIALEVCRKHGVNFVDLRSPRRDRPTVTARQEAFWRCRHETTMSLPQIGAKFGGRDHTTVLHGVRMHEQRMQEAQNG